ncbi:TPA: sigma-54-dependent Fis family transcriptional regulator [Klebsiella pneumoniae]|nr:sigma-54-dependent Fis family transcriptional regulator [Klebsiella pneumoniae]
MAGNPFLLAPEVNANPLLSDSWSRCQRYGLDPATEDFPRLGAGELADRLASHRGLQQLAQPVVEALSRQVADLQSVVILSDPDGLVLHTLGDTQALQKAQRVALAPGNLWSESGRGTNAIGTALAIDDGCEIDGRQHFLTRNQNLYCAAMPLQRPDGSIAGVLDISGPANFPHQHTFGWVKAAAKQIEYLWVKQSLHPEQWLMSLHRQVDKLDSVEELLLVFSDNVLTAGNRLAMREFGLSAAQFGQLTFASLFPTLTQTAVSVPLPLTTPQGRYHYRLRAPTRRRVAVSAPPAMHLPFTSPREGEKLLRLLNAGIALCIEGETGSGKEYVSRTLHRHSRWRSGKFVAINCAAIPESLIESELFGYQPGAFTGASKNGYIGKIREADGGVLFLDEIGDMPLALQTRLLRVLQEKEVAPLREWPALETFIATLWHDLGGASRRVTLSNALLVHLSQLPWPGNVRQLQSVLKVMLALADEGDTLTPDALPEAYRAAPAPLPRGGLQAHDEQLIVDTLARVNGNVSRAAQILGIARSTLYRRAARAGRPRR